MKSVLLFGNVPRIYCPSPFMINPAEFSVKRNYFMAKISGKAERVTIGVIGGSGLYEMDGLTNIRKVRIVTPFGKPSDEYIVGTLFGRRVAFLPRHGRGHRIMPTDINYRANIYGMKKLGVERIISVSAVGSMREEIKPGDIVIPDHVVIGVEQYRQQLPRADFA